MRKKGGATVIGLTAPFGSGCSTSAEILKAKLGFRIVRLSEMIRKEWRVKNPSRKPTRADLQTLGNQIRKTARNPGELARLAIEDLTEGSSLVVDGIRNVGEVEYLRETFGRKFYLVAIECPQSERYERLQQAGLYADIDRFREDNERDKDEEDRYGQQVALCVDAADVLLVNDGETTMPRLREKVVEYVDVVTGSTPRYARPDEILMNLAYSASHGSKCLKRQVGAVLVDAPFGRMGTVVGQGFNENPSGTSPCVEEKEYGADPKAAIPGRCYRDIVREKSFTELAKQKARCPACGKPLASTVTPEPPWRCAGCSRNLEDYFWPERAMSWCTAIHAEVASILSAGMRARGTTLYTTTFPCFQCAEKIAQAGITSVVFTEPYPDIRAAERLSIAGIEAIRFEGVRSGRFDEIFSRARPYVATQRAAMSKPSKGQA